MKNNDCLFSDIQKLCNAVSDWLIKKSIIQLKPKRQYPVPVVTSCVITAEPVNTVMCRQDGRGRFPVLLDDHSKCRTNSQRKSQIS